MCLQHKQAKVGKGLRPAPLRNNIDRWDQTGLIVFVEPVNIQIQSMPLQLFVQDVQNFARRIKEALRLQADDYALIHQKKKVVAWIQEQTASLKEKRQQQKKNQGLLTNILNLAGMNETSKKLQNEQMVLQRVKDLMKGNAVNIDQNELEQLAVPSHVKQSLRRLSKQSIPGYVAVVKGPLLKGSYIQSREGLDSCIKAVFSNGLKFTVLGSEPSNVVKHQRSLLEQLFNKLFWKESELSMVIKIQVEKENFEKSFDIYCYIEDVSTKEWGVLKQLGEIMRDKDENISVMSGDRKVLVDEMSIFSCLLSQMLTVPIQTIVSDYAVAIEADRAKLVRIHKKSDFSYQIKEHPSLRSPLFYFSNYIKVHQFSIQSIKSMLELRHFFEDFYQILNILIDLMQKDFTIKTPTGKINSLLITHSFFHAIWKIFHEFVILSNWIEQVISPIKQTITLFEINAKIMPIFNQILKLQKGTFDEYQKLLLNFPIENYLTMNVSKATIEHYKDRFININTTEVCPSNSEIFESIFQKTIKDYNISNINTHEVIYFFNFIAKHHSLIYKDNYAGCHPSWRNRKIWKEMSQAINRDYHQIKYLSVCLEFLGFYFDFDFKKYSDHPFDSVLNDEQAPRLFERIEIFTKVLKHKYERKHNEYLSLLLQRAFRYGKYKVAQFLIKKGIQLVNYDEIFTNSPELPENYQKMAQKQATIQYMKDSEPEMFRNFRWQEFVNLKMKQEKSSAKVFQTVRRGKFSLPSDLQSNFQSKNMMSNTLSRKDYMYSNTRHIGKIAVKKQEAYIEMTQYPLLRYFYQFFLKKVNKSSLMPNFCGFFTNTGKLIHLIQSLPNCSNYKKTLTVSCQADLAKHIDHQEISEAIIISMMLMPANISLKNIFISYGHANKHGLNGNYNHFVVDFHDFYQKNGFQFSAGSANLKVKNSLFLFQEMKSAISPKLMKKYVNLAIFDVINNVFKESALLVSQVNRMKKDNQNMPQQERQLLSIIFQDNFCESLVERMFKIQRALDKSLKTKARMSHLQLLEIINPQLSYYYNEIIESSGKLIDRQRCLMDEAFKKPLVVNNNLINFFPNPVNTEESRDSFPNHYRKFTFQGPSQNLASFYQNILKFDIYTKKIAQLGDYNQSVIEYFIMNIDFSLYQKQQRENLINKIQDYSKLYLKKEKNCLPLSIIRFSNIEQLREKNVYFSGQRLKELILQHTSCSESDVNTILRRYESMRSIIIRNVSTMQKIGDSFTAISDTYDFKNLRYLSIVGCKDLLNINLKCEQLQQVTLRKNPSLAQIYVFSKKLKDMDCYECPKLRLENVGVYILKKVNVLLSPTCCEGQVKKLQDKNYSVFLTKILSYLLNCFESSKTYKMELIMTLIRLELIDEKLLGLKHNQIYNKNMTSTLAKLGLEVLDIAVSQIFDIFLRNDLVEVLNFDQLLKINVKHLAIIDDYFTKVLKMKENSWYNYRRNFTSLIFNGSNKFNESANQQLKFVKTLLTLIDIDKTLQFHLSISNDNYINGYSELINLLNKRVDLQNLYLKISNSTISNHFMKYLFTLEGPRNRICKIQFSNCSLKVDQKVVIALSFIKSLIFTECRISCLDFIENFTYLTNLQFNSCKFDHEILWVYEKVGKLKSLLNLSIINIKRNLKDGKLHLGRLFDNLMKLGKLQYFDFSDNQLDKDEISYFSAQIHKVKIYQLNLYNFHEDGLNEYINFFLYHESIKIIGIEFKLRSIKFFEAFIDTLSHNTNIVKLNLKTDQQFETRHFQKIKNNNKLEAIQSNHPIPNSIKNHINNKCNKSISAILSEESFEPDRSSREKNEDYCRIGLSLDGGGARGLLLATSMDYISRKVGKPLHKIFDYIGGTSIGGVLALASTGTSDGNTPICSTQQLMDIFQIYGDSIFRKTQFSNIVSLFETKYDIRSYSDMLYGYFKETKLSDVLKGTNVVVNAVNRHTNEDVIFRSINAIFDRNQDFYMKDVARATSAAPIYFPSAQIKNVNATVSYSLIDGGVGLNNPSKLVIDDIIKITQNQAHKKNYFLLSLGTGKLRNEAVPANAGIKDIAPIIDSLTISANYFLEKDLSENYRGHYLRVSPYLDMDRKDSQLDNTTPETYNAYKKFALDAAQENYSSTIAFGKFKNQSFIEWLRENTDRKQETR